MKNGNQYFGATGLQTRGLFASPTIGPVSAMSVVATTRPSQSARDCHPRENGDPASFVPVQGHRSNRDPQKPWRRNLPALIVATLLAALAATPAHAIGLGARAGASFNPDQFVVGGQAMLGNAFPMLELAPGIDFGFGNDIQTAIVNVDFRFNLPSLPKVSPNLYVGAGPAWVSWKPKNGERDSKIAASLLAGLRIPFSPVSSYNLEARFGLGDYPDLKFMGGILIGL